MHLIEWSKNDKQLQNDNKYVVGGKDDRHLTIKSPTYEDRGNYTCKVTNLVGSKSKNIMLGNFNSLDSLFSYFVFLIFFTWR